MAKKKRLQDKTLHANARFVRPRSKGQKAENSNSAPFVQRLPREENNSPSRGKKQWISAQNSTFNKPKLPKGTGTFISMTLKGQ